MIATSGADENVQCQKGSKWSALRGSTQERGASKRFRFDYEEPANDKRVPDRVGSGNLALEDTPADVNQPDSQIRRISDTARWVAVYRARESEWPDAVFRDRFARRLAGVRGARIAASIPFAEKKSWPLVART